MTLKLSQINKKLSSLFILSLAALASQAQTYRLPGQHTEQSNDLLAHQQTATHTISVNPTIDYLNFTTEKQFIMISCIFFVISNGPFQLF